MTKKKLTKFSKAYPYKDPVAKGVSAAAYVAAEVTAMVAEYKPVECIV